MKRKIFCCGWKIWMIKSMALEDHNSDTWYFQFCCISVFLKFLYSILASSQFWYHMVSREISIFNPAKFWYAILKILNIWYAILTSLFQGPKSATVPIHYSHSSYLWWKINSTDFLNIHLSTETSKCVKYANTLTLHNHPHCNRIY